MTSEQGTHPGTSRPRTKGVRRRPWMGAEYLLCLFSLIVVLSMVGGTSWNMVQAIVASEQALAAEEQKGDSYITYIYNAFAGNKTTQEPETEPDGFDPSQVDLTQFEWDDGYGGDLYAKLEENPEEITTILSHYEGAVVTVDGEETTVSEVCEGAIPERLLKMAPDYPDHPLCGRLPGKIQPAGGN